MSHDPYSPDATNNEAFYGLDPEVKFCRKCVISNQRPSSTVEFKNLGKKKETISFDDEGICAACRYAEIKNTIDWEKREQELVELCSQYRSKAGNYDCIVPGSGGKDSAFTSHVLLKRFNMHPLTVTWAPHRYTQIGWENFQRWIRAGFDNMLFTPNGQVHRKLTKLAFMNLLHPFQAFIVGQRMIAPQVSVRMGIPLIFYGENQAEYGNNIEDNFIPTMKTSFFTGDGDPKHLVLGGVTGEELIREHGLTEKDLLPYMPVDKDKLDKAKTVVYYLGYYLKWDPQECYYYAAEHTGFQANDQRTEGSYSKYASIDDRIDPLHYYTTYIKFGIGRCTYDAAQEIRNGKITREEGIALIKKFDAEVPTRYLAEMLDYMMVTEQEFFTRIDEGRSPHLWMRENNEWKLRRAIWQEEEVLEARRVA